MRTVLICILVLAVLSVPAPLATADDPVGPQTEPEEPEEDFIPTEEVPADSAISFPVDI